MFTFLHSLCLISGLAFAQPAQSQQRLLVAQFDAGTLAILDPVSGAAVSTVRTGSGPRSIAVSPDGTMALVSNYGHAQGGQTISVIDIHAARVVRSVRTRFERKHLDGTSEKTTFHRPASLAFLPGGTEFVAALETEGRLLFIDVASGTVRDAVDLGGAGAREVLVDTKRRLVLVSNPTAGSISVVDYGRRRLEATIEAGGGACGMALQPGGGELWVANAQTNSISVIDLERLEETTEFPAGVEPVDLVFTQDGTRVVCANRQAGTLSVFATDSRKAIEEVVLDRTASRASVAPVHLIAPKGAQIYVSCSGTDSVRIVDTGSWRVTGELAVGAGAAGLAWVRGSHGAQLAK